MPVQGYAENRRPKHGVGYLEGRAVLLEPFTPGAVDGAGDCRYRLELQPPWAGTLRVRDAGGAAIIRTCRIRTSSA